MTYGEKLTKPKWQKKRLLILERDKFTCQICNDTEETLQVHHKTYIAGRLPWEYENSNFTTLCKTCHNELSFHIKKHSNQDEFDLLKHKNGGKETIITYSKGELFIIQEGILTSLNEELTKKLIHFTINNWLKNG